MNSAKKQNKIKSKPTITKFKVKNARQARISKEDEQKIMEYFDINKMPRMKNIVTLLIETGIRKGEMYKLTRETMLVDKGKHGCIVLYDTKNGEDRIVPLTQKAMEALVYLFQTSETKYAVYEKYNKLRYDWEKMKKAIGKETEKDFVIHTCRHTCCTRLLANNAPLKKVQLWLGHKRIETTMRYTHLIANDIMDMTKFLEEPKTETE